MVRRRRATHSVFSLNPGTITTPGSLTAVPSWLHLIFKLIASTPLMGTKNTLFLATAPQVREQDLYCKGRFVKEDGQVILGHPAAQSSALARQLWETTEVLVKTFKEKHGL